MKISYDPEVEALYILQQQNPPASEVFRHPVVTVADVDGVFELLKDLARQLKLALEK